LNRKVCVVTGSRAEFGLLRYLTHKLQDAEAIDLQLIATGMHLSPEYGMTFQEIVAEGFCIDAKIEMLLSGDTKTAVTKSMGLGLIGFADAFENLNPDIVVLLGDRFEIFAAASAALIAGIPIAHIHGGETTEGAFDEAIRHSITKMSHLHFAGAEEYRQRVIQLGEHPDRVFNVGGLGIDAINSIELLSQAELEKSIDFNLRRKNLLITFHPITLEGSASSAEQMGEMLSALSELQDTGLILTMPNADPGGSELAVMVDAFVSEHDNARVFTSLGQLRYLSLMKLVDGVVGNSSSGLLEAPSFHLGTVNIGDRQKGRLRAKSVIDCEPTKACISVALEMLFSSEFRLLLDEAINPYGEGGASTSIVEELVNADLEDLLIKSFYDLPVLST
jgi:GDP/UDP-N,N'-diacetylbacillosamine 2-epimerase (hydrolysing)